MPYTYIPGTRARFNDGALKQVLASGQPRILVIGPAESGLTNEHFTMANLSAAEAEFGSGAAIMRVIHEAVAQGADNFAIMRSGGRAGSFILEDSAGETLTITPELKDDTVLERYALVIENDGSVNRFLVYDIEDETYIYDSSEILAQDTGIVEVDDTGIELMASDNVIGSEAAFVSLADLVVGDFSPAAADLTQTAGADGQVPSLVERYAAYNTTLHSLDFRDADLVLPVDVYIDDENIADDSSAATYGYFWKGVPIAGDARDKLGYLWQYIYRGRLYTYFTDTADFFSATSDFAEATVSTDLTITALVAGLGGNACTIQITDVGSNPIEVTITENANGGLSIVASVDVGVDTTLEAETAINAALAAFTLENGRTGDELLEASGGTGTIIGAVVAETALSGGLGGHVLTHEDLTGEAIPSGVSTRFDSAVDAELRECNFAHQLASFCELASTTWSPTLGIISFKEPPSYSRLEIADWIGDLPTFTNDGTDIFIDAPADNGSGVLGNKFMAGFSKTSAGYRSEQVDNGNSTDGYAYGGLIKTVGASLPNGSDFPYGIDSSDEATDAKGKPIDIGKHLFVTYDWPIISTGFDGGSTYRGSIVGIFAGKLAITPVNEEPIGDNGKVRAVQTPPRIHSTQIDQLAQIRVIGLRREEGVGFIVVSAKTAAHPDSDYTRVSTIRCVSKMLKSVRTAVRPYIGKPFTTERTLALQAAIDNVIVAERALGTHQGAKATLSFSRQDKILGKITVNLSMVPPFAIEQVTTSVTVAAEESEL